MTKLMNIPQILARIRNPIFKHKAQGKTIPVPCPSLLIYSYIVNFHGGL